MPLPRFHLRTLMVVIVFIGLVMGAGIAVLRLDDKARGYRRKAMTYRQNVVSFRSVIWNLEKTAPGPHYGRLPLLRKRADYQAFLRDKYERAARSPWLPVLPDPPMP